MAIITLILLCECQSKKKYTDQQLKEEPGIFVRVLSADPGADDHLQGQLLVKLLQETKHTKRSEREPPFSG